MSSLKHQPSMTSSLISAELALCERMAQTFVDHYMCLMERPNIHAHVFYTLDIYIYIYIWPQIAEPWQANGLQLKGKPMYVWLANYIALPHPAPTGETPNSYDVTISLRLASVGCYCYHSLISLRCHASSFELMWRQQISRRVRLNFMSNSSISMTFHLRHHFDFELAPLGGLGFTRPPKGRRVHFRGVGRGGGEEKE
jgi:hypothetical protein